MKKKIHFSSNDSEDIFSKSKTNEPISSTDQKDLSDISIEKISEIRSENEQINPSDQPNLPDQESISIEKISEIRSENEQINPFDQPHLPDQESEKNSKVNDFLKTLASEKFPTDRGNFKSH